MYSSWTAPNTSRPPCMEPWRPSLHIPRFCFAFHRCRDGEWCCAIQGPNAGLFQSCAWILPLPASEMRKQPSFLVLGRRQALGGKPCGMKVGSTFGQVPYSILFIFIHPIGLLIFFGSGGQSSCQVLSHSFLAEVYGRLSRDAGSDLAKLTKAGTCSGLTIGFADHWSTDKTWQDICHICARTQHQVLATTGQMYQSEVKTQPDYMNFLHDERCWGVDCGNKAAVAFHSLLGSACCTARRHFRHCAWMCLTRPY